MIRAGLFLIAALTLALGWSLWRAEVHKGDAAAATVAAEQAAAELAQQKAARAVEHTRAATSAQIGDKHEQDRSDAAGVPGAVVADLQSGDLQLRDELAGCATDRLSGSVAAALERNEAAQLRNEIAGAVVQVGRDADDHVNASHAVIRADREVP